MNKSILRKLQFLLTYKLHFITDFDIVTVSLSSGLYPDTSSGWMLTYRQEARWKILWIIIDLEDVVPDFKQI